MILFQYAYAYKIGACVCVCGGVSRSSGVDQCVDNGLRSESVFCFSFFFPRSILQDLLVRGLESPFVAHSLPPHTIKGPIYLENFVNEMMAFALLSTISKRYR